MSVEREEWRSIPGLEPYEASDFGNIRRNGRLILPLRLPHGYIHKNGVKTDNRPENLEHVTRGENMLHAHRTGIIPKKQSCRKPRILKGGRQRGENHWMRRRPESILRGLGISRAQVCRIVNRKHWVHL